MTQKVTIRKGEKIIRVHFMYNIDLINIMQKHRGWWFRKEKAWQFPLWKLEDVYDDLTKEHYNVEITKLIEQPKKEDKKQTKLNIDYWKDKDVIGVYGKCIKCGNAGFIDKNKICGRCK